MPIGEYGVGTFSVDFEATVPGYNQFLFTTGTCNHWMIMTKVKPNIVFIDY